MKKIVNRHFCVILLLLGACSTSTNSNSSESDVKGDGEETGSTGKQEVVFWHAMSGELETVLNDIVADFNKSQDNIEVKPISKVHMKSL